MKFSFEFREDWLTAMMIVAALVFLLTTCDGARDVAERTVDAWESIDSTAVEN